MRTVLDDFIEAGRIKTGPFGSDASYCLNGAFSVNGPCGRRLKIVASEGLDFMPRWEHVSVSLSGRPPNWQEMCWVKDKFWYEDELVIQFHPPKSQYINFHAHCLHLWKPPYPVQLPPSILIGPNKVVA